MKALAYPLDANAKPIPTAPFGNHNIRLATPTGTNATLVPLPAGSKVVQVASLSADVYLKAGKAGDATLLVTAPAATVTDGSAPDFVPAGATQLFAVQGETALAVLSLGDVYITVFG